MGLQRVRQDLTTEQQKGSNALFNVHLCMATHSSILAWRIPGTGEPGGLPSMGSHRVGHDWSNLAAAADIKALICCCCSVAKSCPTLNPLQAHELQHARLASPSLSPRVCSNSCPLSQWCYLTFLSSTALFSFCFQSFPASGSFPVSQLFTLDGQSTGASASVLSMNTQGWFPLGLTFMERCFII